MVVCVLDRIHVVVYTLNPFVTIIRSLSQKGVVLEWYWSGIVWLEKCTCQIYYHPCGINETFIIMSSFRINMNNTMKKSHRRN